MEGSPEEVTKHTVQDRAARYATLRAAKRALSGSVREAATSGLDETVFEIRTGLSQLSAVLSGKDGASITGRPAPSVLLAKIDAGLDDVARTLRAQLDDAPLTQLRATLPAVCDRHPDEVAALLDLCLPATPQVEERDALIDYLVTLLSTEDRGGVRHLSANPTAVTPRLLELCRQAEQSAPPEALELADDFDEARRELARTESLWPLVARMRSSKTWGTRYLLVPVLLKAIVKYNLAVWNRQEELQEVERTLDEAEWWNEEPEAAGPALESAFESSALDAVAGAIAARLAWRDPPEGVPEDLAEWLEPERFSLFEEECFRAAAADSVAVTVRVAVCLGLLARKLPDEADRVRALGIDPDQMQGDWIEEAGQRLRAATQECLGANRFDDARKLAEVRTHNLLRPGEGRESVWALERDEPPPPTEKAKSAPRRSKPVRRSKRATAAKEGRTRRDVVKAVVMVASLVGSLALFFVTRTTGTVDIFTPEELAAVSLYLESGYRNDHGVGPLFIGTLKEDWAQVPAQKRNEAALEAGEALRQMGVKDMMLFDKQRRLQVHLRLSQDAASTSR